MMRKGRAHPGIGDGIILGLAVSLSLVFLLAGQSFRLQSASFLRRTVFQPFRLVMGYAPARVDLTAEDILQRHQEALCQVDRARWREAGRENARFRELLGFAKRAGESLLPTEVIGRSADRFGEVLKLAGGGNSGIHVGQAVVGVEGLVGVVAALEPEICFVRTWRHDGLAISGLLQDSRYVGRLRWDRHQRQLRLDGIPLQSVIGDREWVVTSGYGGIFPRGIPIGEVLSIQDDSTGLVKQIGVLPFVDLDKTEEVFLLTAAADSVDLPRAVGPAAREE